MPKPTKRAQKALPSPSVPSPFTPAPTELLPLLSTLSKDSVYIIHLDYHPSWFKRRIFLVPVGLNVTIVAVLLWRAYVQFPFYWELLLSFLGNPNDTTIYFATTHWADILKTVAWRGLVFFFDWMLFRIVGPWPWTFFFESPGNPVTWRFNVGFRDEEVYVRESRGWTAKDLLGEAEGATGKAGGDSPFFKTRILPALDGRRLREKTGYLLMDKGWDLDFAGMTTATSLLDKNELSSELLRKVVFVWVGPQESGQWAVWDCWKLDEGSETEARQKIMLFKDRLTAMGKEDLFFKWVELVQFESSASGGFTQERQVATAEKAKKLFEDQGIDFDTFINEIGGLGGMPGMEEAGPD
ncbi:uncharacterized protein BDR25DRAFT_132312 [Lindgomyces ingoldianus]|uniref:Uncharacterized protein n=1 Tax=Lindgomyces ingoldianus TaxID=673940 RepID=A0ACB6R2V0_9PLEO|nr:uncharacterized protein BDR25DRAFT_132312 [Lindgomyces ingoldianus]KAF2473471.1 hypothetical protein BDR25DRAFT_132312 [Lindgomyces ingoldianus]